MKHLLQNLVVVAIAIAIPFASFSQIPGNDNCVNSTLLTPNATCVSGTTYGGTIQGGEVADAAGGLCNGGNNNQTESVWYRFVANASTMHVELRLTGVTGSGSFDHDRWTSTVYNAGCMPVAANIINCQNSTSQNVASGFGAVGDQIIINRLSGLTVGNTYYIQVSYRGTLSPGFCIRVLSNITNCGTCNSPCGPGCPQVIQPPTPTIAYANCPAFVTTSSPIDEGGYLNTHCWTFTANASTVTYYGYVQVPAPNIIVPNPCPGSFVTPPTPIWTLQTSNSGSGCGPVIQTGSSVNNIAMNGLTVGQSYTFCLTAMVFPRCYILNYLAVFVGAQNLPAPVELVSFSANPNELGVNISWHTESELNNDYFIVERSVDGEQFEEITRLAGAGTSTNALDYQYLDPSPFQGPNYYRLVQVDLDQISHYSNIVIVNFGSEISELNIYPNPVENWSDLSVISGNEGQANINVIDAVGRTCVAKEVLLREGKNTISLDFSQLRSGLYHLILYGRDGSRSIAFEK